MKRKNKIESTVNNLDTKLVIQGDKNQSADEWFRVLTTLGTTLMTEELFSKLSPCRLLETVQSTSSFF